MKCYRARFIYKDSQIYPMCLCETDIILPYNPNKESNDKYKIILKYKIKEYLYDHYANIVINSFDSNITLKDKYNIDDVFNWEEVTKKIWEKDRPKYKAISVVEVPVCEGCRYNAQGQRDHMDINGCLYMTDEY